MNFSSPAEAKIPMNLRLVALASLLLSIHSTAGFAQAPVLPPGDKDPLLRLEAGGPTSFVTALAFSPDGRMLYAAGWDKVVRVWTRNAQGQFVPDPVAYRVPVGPDDQGMINAIALSEDGGWLAVGGLGVFRQGSGFRRHGWVVPSEGGLSKEMLQDRGTIYLFNTRNQSVRLLRGHLGPVVALAFAPQREDKPLLLASVARERDRETGQYGGVVRLWDADQGTYLDGISGDGAGPLPDPKIRPGVVVRHTGAGAKQLQVALAWNDGRFRVWDVEANQVWSSEDDKYNLTVAALPGRSQIVTATYGIKKARLKLWNIPPGREPQAGPSEAAPAGQSDSLGRALALVSGAADGQPNYAATVVAVPRGTKEAEYRLQLLDLDENNLGALKADVPLWTGSLKQPAVAAAVHGRHVAVAGNAGHEIMVYAVQDLLNGGAQPQRLHGAGASQRLAAFVRKGPDLGLLLSETAGKAPGELPRQPAARDMIFDLAKRSLTADSAGWQTVVPAANGWRVEQPDATKPALVVYQGDREAGRVVLGASEAITDFALLPPRPPFQLPILAIATGKEVPPLLRLYNAATGEQFRQFSGHTDPIHCLAFSDDGRFLVSAAEAQTVAVWSLTNLDKVLQRIGLLRGVAVKDSNGSLVVARVDAARPAHGKLAKDDIIEALVEDAGPRRLASPRDFYEAIARIGPGKTATLRLRGGAGPRDVKVDVGQGIDERKPLFTLFIAGDGKPEERDWIGWNPIGPYDSSGQKAERFLGWHFNTGEAAAPTRFALADQYRKQYYRKDILKDLVAQGDLKQVPPAPPPPPPQMGLLIDDQGQFSNPDGQGQFPVSHARVTLRLQVLGRPLDSLESLTWSLDGGPEQPLDLKATADPFLEVPLDLRRGVHKVRVVARAPEKGPQEYAEELTVRYQPLAPVVKYQGPHSLVVNRPEFTLEALVRPGQVGEAVSVNTTHKHKDQTLLAETATQVIDPDRPLTVRKDLKLQPGKNYIELVAVNQDALRGYEASETSRLVLDVTLVQKAKPPSITLAAVQPEGQAGKLPVELGKSVRIDIPKIMVLGTIEAAGEEDLARAELARDPVAPVALTDFRPGESKKLTVRQVVQLRPGAQTLRFLAQTATSDEAEYTLTVEYQPQLPAVVIAAPARGEILYGEKDTGAVQLQARLGLPAERHPYKAEILVDDKPLADPPVIDEQAQSLSARVPLTPGGQGHRIQVRLSNAWGAVGLSDDTVVRYLRPPRVVKVEAPAESSKPFLDLVARVRSPLPLPREAVKVEVNGQWRPAAVAVPDQPEDGVWAVRLTEVPLDVSARESNLRVWVSNREGECREPGTVTVIYKPVLKPPVVEFLEPQQNGVVSSSRLAVRFLVRSTSPLKRLALIHDKEKPQTIDLAGLQPGPDGAFEIKRELRLTPGLNHLRLEAVNDGGQQDAPLVVNYAYKPVRVVLDELVPRVAGSQPIPAKALPGGKFTFPEVAQGYGRLRGRVLWDEADDERLKKTEIVRIYVNGFQQLPATLRPPVGAARERTFQADLMLNQAGANQIALLLPDLAQDACSCTHLTMECRQPVRAQRLHVLAVSLLERNRDRLKQQVRQALHCDEEERGPTGKPVFESVNVAEALAGYYARAASVRQQLLQIQANITALARSGTPCTDVVVFYYQGGESVNAQGNFLLTGGSPSAGMACGDMLSCDDLVEQFAATPGAHVLLFDVGLNKVVAAQAEEVRDKVARWEDSYGDVKFNISVLRYAWLGRTDNPQARLLKALDEAMPRSSRLVEVTEQVRKFAAASPDYLKSLAYDQWVPEQMKEILFGQRR
jgi:WD40 repeat protein